MKKFEIGLSDNISVEEWENLFKNYSSHIDFLYFSVPLGLKYQTRLEIFKGKTYEEATKYLYSVLSLAEKYKIKKELCLNAYNLSSSDISDVKKYLKDDLHKEIDAVVSLLEYDSDVFYNFPDVYHIVSYNSGIRSYEMLEKIPKNKYDEIVLIPLPYLNNYKFWEDCQSKGLNVRILLNNGCSPNCVTCRFSNYCRLIFDLNLSRHGLNYLVATQTIFPYELHKVLENNKNVNSYKISSRPSSYRYLNQVLDNYINNVEYKNEDFHLYCRLNHFDDYLDNGDSLDLQEIYNIKSKLWSLD